MDKKIYYHKLIRDKIPQAILDDGGHYETLKLKQKDFELELLKKVGEEASGLLGARSKKELISELADIMDVFDEILRVKKITRVEISKQQKENSQRKGGFSKKLFLIWSANDKYKTNERIGNDKK